MKLGPRVWIALFWWAGWTAVEAPAIEVGGDEDDCSRTLGFLVGSATNPSFGVQVRDCGEDSTVLELQRIEIGKGRREVLDRLRVELREGETIVGGNGRPPDDSRSGCGRLGRREAEGVHVGLVSYRSGVEEGPECSQIFTGVLRAWRVDRGLGALREVDAREVVCSFGTEAGCDRH